ncbi:MAG: helix-turn-helix transcriptional regulator [Flavobacteriaceae bacterium]|nr:helix-turn-helix transcriptional regulator [Flavobacteriaceae bacterium]
MEKSEMLKAIGENIKKIRLEKGLTQVDLVGKIEARIDTTNISRIEKGRTNATIHTLFRISEALEVPLAEICQLKKNKTFANNGYNP